MTGIKNMKIEIQGLDNMTCQWKVITNVAHCKDRFHILSLQCADDWVTVFGKNVWGCSVSAFQHEVNPFGAGEGVVGRGRWILC